MGSPRSKDSSTDRIQEMHVESDEVSRKGKPTSKGRIIMSISAVGTWRLTPSGNSICRRTSQSYIIPGREITEVLELQVLTVTDECCSCRALFLWRFLPWAVWAAVGQKAPRWLEAQRSQTAISEGV